METESGRQVLSASRHCTLSVFDLDLDACLSKTLQLTDLLFSTSQPFHTKLKVKDTDLTSCATWTTDYFHVQCPSIDSTMSIKNKVV